MPDFSLVLRSSLTRWLSPRAARLEGRPAAFFGFVAVCVFSATLYVSFAMRRTTQLGAPHGHRIEVTPPTAGRVLAPRAQSAVAQADPRLDALRRAPRLYYRSLREGERGRVVIAGLAAPEEQRLVTELRCDRAHFGKTRGICVASDHVGLTGNVSATLLDAHLVALERFELSGFPSRARISPDERFAATTVFVSGDDYAADFSTRTKIFEVASGRLLPDIEFFDVYRDGEPFQRIDFNYWGITFTADGHRAYATLSTEGTTYLVSVDIPARRVEILRENVECPSLAPDGARLVYKRRVGAGGQWRLHVLELDTLHDRAVGTEARSIDDQVEWLDEQHVLYAVPVDPERPELDANVWVSRVHASHDERPSVFVRSATSPAVVR